MERLCKWVNRILIVMFLIEACLWIFGLGRAAHVVTGGNRFEEPAAAVRP
jgi:hypothetical protein